MDDDDDDEEDDLPNGGPADAGEDHYCSGTAGDALYSHSCFLMTQ